MELNANISIERAMLLTVVGQNVCQSTSAIIDALRVFNDSPKGVQIEALLKITSELAIIGQQMKAQGAVVGELVEQIKKAAAQ